MTAPRGSGRLAPGGRGSSASIPTVLARPRSDLPLAQIWIDTGLVFATTIRTMLDPSNTRRAIAKSYVLLD